MHKRLLGTGLALALLFVSSNCAYSSSIADEVMSRSYDELFSDDQIERYTRVVLSIEERINQEHISLFPTIEEMIDPHWTTEYEGALYTTGIPGENDISMGEALFFAYEHVEDNFALSEEDLGFFCPVFVFLTSIDTEQTIWNVNLLGSMLGKTHEETGIYLVHVNGKTGEVLGVDLAEDIAG